MTPAEVEQQHACEQHAENWRDREAARETNAKNRERDAEPFGSLPEDDVA